MTVTGKKIVILISFVLTAALATWAFAAEDTVTGSPKAGSGAGYHHGAAPQGHGGSGYGACGMRSGQNISQEDMEKIQAACKTFCDNTQGLRADIKSKRLAVKSELAKETPDADTAVSLQRELSDLEAQLDQQRIAHLLELKKISPSAGAGCMDGCMKLCKGPKQKSGCPMMDR